MTSNSTESGDGKKNASQGRETSSGVRTVNQDPAAATDTGRAAESSDPAVHKLLADQDIARQNGDDETVERITKELRKLGFTQ
jgi:hypothetical protein